MQNIDRVGRYNDAMGNDTAADVFAAESLRPSVGPSSKVVGSLPLPLQLGRSRPPALRTRWLWSWLTGERGHGILTRRRRLLGTSGDWWEERGFLD